VSVIGHNDMPFVDAVYARRPALPAQAGDAMHIAVLLINY
jgi:hypothetical protein